MSPKRKRGSHLWCRLEACLVLCRLEPCTTNGRCVENPFSTQSAAGFRSGERNERAGNRAKGFAAAGFAPATTKPWSEERS